MEDWADRFRESPSDGWQWLIGLMVVSIPISFLSHPFLRIGLALCNVTALVWLLSKRPRPKHFARSFALLLTTALVLGVLAWAGLALAMGDFRNIPSTR